MQIYIEIHPKLKSYGPDKNLPSSVTLALCLSDRMPHMAHLHVMENTCVKLF